MVLSPHTLIYASLFVFNELVFCNHYVQNGTDYRAAARKDADETRTTAWQKQQRATLDCKSDRDDGNAACVGYELMKTVVAKRPMAVPQRNTNATTPKPRFQKPATGRAKATTTRAPPVRQSNATKPSEKKSAWTVSGQTSTVWPKPNKRLSSKTTDAKTSVPNRTKEASGVMAADAKLTAKYPIGKWRDHGFYTDDYIKLINSHWLEFEPPSFTAHCVLGVLYTVIMVFGCFGNFLVIFMYIKLVPT